jgi:hypothetical protein
MSSAALPGGYVGPGRGEFNFLRLLMVNRPCGLCVEFWYRLYRMSREPVEELWTTVGDCPAELIPSFKNMLLNERLRTEEIDIADPPWRVTRILEAVDE